jgi:hypothetical protein
VVQLALVAKFNPATRLETSDSALHTHGLLVPLNLQARSLSRCNRDGLAERRITDIGHGWLLAGHRFDPGTIDIESEIRAAVIPKEL